MKTNAQRLSPQVEIQIVAADGTVIESKDLYCPLCDDPLAAEKINGRLIFSCIGNNFHASTFADLCYDDDFTLF